jgi:uncharacterized protein (TIGR00290 family)
LHKKEGGIPLKPAYISWSGGKDCCLALYQARQDGLDIKYMANMLTEDGAHSRTHGLSHAALQLQSRALGIPLIQGRTTWENYEENFRKLLGRLKAEGIDDGVYGDIDLDEHREWVERVSQLEGITAHLPLWGLDQNDIVNRFIDLGFEAVVVAVQTDKLGEEWLGRTLDRILLAELAELGNVTPCGEAGEYHTLVINGPIFEKRLQITETGRLTRDGYHIMEIIGIGLEGD